ncbi:MAG: cytidylate kinase-like family protein [Rikenellaceae bacterium]|nr:cytidylate kinase-like family protein [Rikenellaceae bacterium]
MENNHIICIGRQLGSGGHEIGERLAAKLGYSFFDKELIKLASMESGLSSDFFEKADEKINTTMFDGIFNMSDNCLSNEALFKIQSDVIRKLAENGSSVFVGRCADYVLKDYQEIFTVFITADIEDRVRRVMMHNDLSKNEAISLIEKTDKKRAAYYNFYSNKIWGRAESYDLCINSSVMGVEGTVNFLSGFVEEKYK